MPSIELSVIIVSYNAKYYLLNTLHSLDIIAKEIGVEVIVVDNASTEYSIDEIADLFPAFSFIQNERNYGFSKANNIGVQNSNCDTLLFLNPDTIISKETILLALQNISSKNIGGICVKMIDGRGQYLPESNRGFPDMKTSFLKLTGLNRLISNDYYKQSKYADVLAGACLFMKREVFEQVGRWDENYFMYGEDIDLSFQIKHQGLKILYQDQFPIVHFKGKSTDKSVLKNNITFYHAMKLYWKKNLSTTSSLFNKLLVSIGTLLLTMLSWFKYLTKKLLIRFLIF